MNQIPQDVLDFYASLDGSNPMATGPTAMWEDPRFNQAHNGFLGSDGQYYLGNYQQDNGGDFNLAGYRTTAGGPDTHVAQVGQADRYYNPDGTYDATRTNNATPSIGSGLAQFGALAAGMYFGLPALMGEAGGAGASAAGYLNGADLMSDAYAGGAGGFGGGSAGALSSAADPGIWDMGGQSLWDSPAPGVFNPAADSQLANSQLGLGPYSGGAEGVTSSPIGYDSPYTNTSSTFNAAKDSQLANEGISSGGNGFEGWTAANGTDPLAGYTAAGNGGVTGTPTYNTTPPGAGSSGSGSGSPSLSDLSKVASVISSLTGGAGAGSGTATSPPTSPHTFDEGNWLPPGWASDRPMYRPGVDAIPEGWLGAGGAKLGFTHGGSVHGAGCNCRMCGGGLI